MARTYQVTNVAIRKSIYEEIEKKKKVENRLGPTTAYISEILAAYVRGELINSALFGSQIEAKIRADLARETEGRGIVHRGRLEGLGLKYKGIASEEKTNERKHRPAA